MGALGKKDKATPKDLEHIAKMYKIEVTRQEGRRLVRAFSVALANIDTLKEIEGRLKRVTPIGHVGNLKNVFRQDKVDCFLSQVEALSSVIDCYQGFVKIRPLFPPGGEEKNGER